MDRWTEKKEKRVGGPSSGTSTKNEKLLSSNSRYTLAAWRVLFNSRHARGRVPSKIAKGGEIFIDVFLQPLLVNRWRSRASQITGGWIIKKRGEGGAGLIKSERHLGDWRGCECLCKFSEEPGKIFRDIFEHYSTDITPVITCSVHSSWNSIEFRVHRQWMQGQCNQRIFSVLFKEVLVQNITKITYNFTS